MAWIDDELASARVEVAQAPMLPLTIVNSQVVNITNEIGYGVKAHTMEQMNRYGVAQLLTTRQTAVPLLEDAVEEYLVRVFPLAIAFQITQDEADLAMSTNKPIVSSKMMGAREALERELDIIGYEGRLSTTLRGIANHPNITIIDFPADGDENGGTNSVAWEHKTPMQILRDLNLVATEMLEQTANTVNIDRLLMPISKVNMLNSTVFNALTGESIMTVFMRNQANMPNGGVRSIIGHPSLETMGTGSVGRIVGHNTTSRYNRFHIPQGGDFRDLDPSTHSGTTDVVCQMKTAGMEIQRLKEVIYANVS